MNTPPQWLVIYYNFNAKEIQTFNVLSHGRFREDIIKAYTSCKTKEEFADEIRRSLMYYYWSKSEWEIVICSSCCSKNTDGTIIDVYKQVMYNWEIFLEYIWNEKERIQRWDEELKKN